MLLADLIAAVSSREPNLKAQASNLNLALTSVATLANAQANQLSFLANPKYAPALAQTRAGAVALSEAQRSLLPNAANTEAIICNNPYAWFAVASQVLNGSFPQSLETNIHPRAVIAPSAIIGKGCDIGAGCVIGENVKLGENCKLYPNVSIYHDCELGANAIIHSGAVIGADGFGFAPFEGRWLKIPQIGRVVIGADVEIGANTTIDRGALDDTVIGKGCKFDNQVQIGHNVRIGDGCVFAGCAAVAGSAVIGNRVQLGGRAGVLGHLSVADDVIIASSSLVTHSIKTAGFYTGIFPLQENKDWERTAASLKRLDAMRKEFRQFKP